MKNLEDCNAPNEFLDGTNGYLYKEQREVMGAKSIICFGSKGKWKKLMKLTVNTVQSMELQMDKIIEMINDQGVLNEKQEPNSFIPNRKLRRKYSKKIRQRQAKGGFVAKQGTNRGS